MRSIPRPRLPGRPRAVGPLLAGAVAALLAFALPAAAQGDRDGGPPAWLGLGLEEHLECRLDPAPGPRPCEPRLVVARVVPGGPSDRAGVQHGDTLLAVGGSPVTSPEARERVLSALRPGQPIHLTVGRGSGRTALRVVPEERPDRFDAVRAGAARLPPEWAVRATPRDRTPAGRDIVEIVTERGDVIRIRRHGAAPAPEGELLRWVELQLGPELQALQDSVFHGARMQMERLRQLHARRLIALRGMEARARAAGSDPEGTRARVLALREARAPFGERRLAGAEFEPLEPELAEFFEADQGLLVLRVLPGTPADRVGLRPGDVVVEAAGAEVLSLDDLRRALLEAREGSVTLTWNRKGRVLTDSLRR